MAITKEQLDARGVDFWQAELEYLEHAKQGMQQAYAIIEDLHRNATEKHQQAVLAEAEKTDPSQTSLNV